MSNFNYFNVVLKSSFFIMKNEIRQTIKWCKSNNASKSNDILNRIFKILVNKLMTHLINLFRVCVALNYHSRCFYEIYIIILKKSKKRITRTSRRINRSLFETLSTKSWNQWLRDASAIWRRLMIFFSSIKWMNAKIAVTKQFWNCWRSKFILFKIWIKTK
jgi:hypothetical protein